MLIFEDDKVVTDRDVGLYSSISDDPRDAVPVVGQVNALSKCPLRAVNFGATVAQFPRIHAYRRPKEIQLGPQFANDHRQLVTEAFLAWLLARRLSHCG